MLLLKKNCLSVYHSINQSYSLIHSVDRQIGNWTKNEIYKEAEFLIADGLSTHLNTLIPTLLYSKLFNVGIPRSHAAANNAELTISAKKIISCMFPPIPVIHETHWYVNPLCPFFPFAQWTLWRTVMIHRLFFHSFYWIKAGRRRQGFSVMYNNFYASTCAKFHVQTSGRTKRLKQVHRHYLI